MWPVRSLSQKGFLALLALFALIALLLGLVLAYEVTAVTDSGQLTQGHRNGLPRAEQAPHVSSDRSAADEQGLQAADRGRALIVALATIAILGATLAGTVVVLFFARLTSDIDRLRVRALAVVVGDRKAARTIARDDELGDLGAALDGMVATLADGERALAVKHQDDFHREKMALIGSLAAGFLGEVGNPIAAIDGFARAMREERDAGVLHFRSGLRSEEHTSELQSPC